MCDTFSTLEYVCGLGLELNKSRVLKMSLNVSKYFDLDIHFLYFLLNPELLTIIFQKIVPQKAEYILQTTPYCVVIIF